MNDEIQIFKNSVFGQIRIVTKEGEPWFVGKDVAAILGYENQNRDIIRHVDEEDREKMDGKTQYQNGIELGQRGGWLINESGLYSLILSSKLPTAKQFKHWVTSDVLPSIRKHGAYMTADVIKKTLQDPDYLICLLTELKSERAKRQTAEAQVKQQKQLIGELKPKADYTDTILSSKATVTITQIAKDYGMSGRAMNRLLHNMHIIYLCGGQWLLYSQYQASGYTHSETVHFRHSDGREDVNMITKWTQKGRLFLYDLLKSRDILPVIERGE